MQSKFYLIYFDLFWNVFNLLLSVLNSLSFIYFDLFMIQNPDLKYILGI